jgi:hypothetical protein
MNGKMYEVHAGSTLPYFSLKALHSVKTAALFAQAPTRFVKEIFSVMKVISLSWTYHFLYTSLKAVNRKFNGPWVFSPKHPKNVQMPELILQHLLTGRLEVQILSCVQFCSAITS